ncbi:hypothetical protein Pyn_25406 [Prunus yedoensis var. nudiflora]|uniref:Uncharacterized protein n=1 Tax=Prunus yedoensis var. nudiflora TaxID=2094558 RepID=A0A314XX47_PRUYE|nr:hypothetical protein Pyn_25406 [Prunus yedoensis var. nudiflora]
MAGGSDSSKERVARIENFLGTMCGDEAESVVTQMGDLNAKIAEIEKILGGLKTSMEKKITDCLGDMDGLAEAIGGKLKEVVTELSVMKLAMSGMTSSHEMGRKSKVGRDIWTTRRLTKGRRPRLFKIVPKVKTTRTKKAFSGCFLCQGPHRVKDCPKKQNLNTIVVKRDGGAEECSNFQVSPMVLLNSLRVVPPEDPLDEDVLVQPVLEVIEVIEVFVDVFGMEPSEILIDASLVHGDMLIKAIENMVPNWDLNCGLEQMQLAALAYCLDTWRNYLLVRKFVARTCVLHNHMYCSSNIRDKFSIYLDVLDESDFELAYMTTRHKDFVE